jgi:hypothetical protein
MITARVRPGEVGLRIILTYRSTWQSVSYCGPFYNSHRRVLHQEHVPTLDQYRYQSLMSTLPTGIPCEAYRCLSAILPKTYRFYHTSKWHPSGHVEVKLMMFDCQLLEQYVGIQRKFTILYRQDHKGTVSHYARWNIRFFYIDIRFGQSGYIRSWGRPQRYISCARDACLV